MVKMINYKKAVDILFGIYFTFSIVGLGGLIVLIAQLTLNIYSDGLTESDIPMLWFGVRMLSIGLIAVLTCNFILKYMKENW